MSVGILIREHRGSLDASMATCRAVTSHRELYSAVYDSMIQFIHIRPEQIKVTPYIYDDRIGWDTHLIEIEGYGVWGMASGAI